MSAPSRPILKTVTVLAVLLWSTGVSPSVPTPARAQEGSGGPAVLSIPLIDAVRKNVSGIQLEVTSLEGLARLKAQARQYVDYRRGKLSSAKRAKLLSECLLRADENPFCNYLSARMLDRWPVDPLFEEILSEGVDADDDPRSGRPSREITTIELAMKIASADLSYVSRASEGQIYKALARFESWEPLQVVADLSLRMWGCPPIPLLTGLGLKAEEYFPKEELKRTAMALYERADRCGDPSSLVAAKARYRLSLLYIWEGKCTQADPILLRLGELSDSIYQTRGHYWRARCALKEGNKLRLAVARNKLQKVNPFGFHTISLSREMNAGGASLLYAYEPLVMSRTMVRPTLNPLIRAIEVLQETGANDLAGEILTSIQDRIDGTEPAFRLYCAVLALRSGDNLSQFRILTRVFQDQPNLISSATLRLFYPMRELDKILSHYAVMDPFISLALIRQESGFNSHARSPAGAMGLMQLMPDTAWNVARVKKERLLNPAVNIRVGVRYLRSLVERYGGDVELALAAYNAGPHRVDAWIKRYPTEDRMLFLDLIPFSETRHYVSLIGRNYFWYHQLYRNDRTRIPAPVRRQLASNRSPLVFSTLGDLE